MSHSPDKQSKTNEPKTKSSSASAHESALAYTHEQYERLVEASVFPANPFLDSSERPIEEAFQFQEPSISLLTGIATGTATPEEVELWETHFASLASAQEQLELCLSFVEDKNVSPYSLFDRGAALLDGMSPLPDDFWEESEHSASIEEAEMFATEMAPEETEVVTQDPLFSEPETEQKASSLANPPPVFLWGGLSTAMFAALFLMLQLPSSSSFMNSVGSFAADSGTPAFPRAFPVHPYQNAARGKGLRLASHNPDKLSITLWVRHNNIKKKAAPSFVSQTGMELRFQYNYKRKKKAYLLILMGNKKGQLEQFYPSKGELPPLRMGNKQYVKGGMVMEASQEPERIYVCISETPTPIQAIREMFRQRLKMDRIEELAGLPWSCLYQRSWLLLPSQEKGHKKEQR